MQITQTRPLVAPANPKSRWSWPHYLALVGAPILLWETWTLTAWLADGPQAITEFRDRSSFNWSLIRVIEGFTVVVAVVMAVYVVRGCRRAGTVLTFDVMFVLCGMSMFWLDAGGNFFQPTWLPSSNWVNLNSPCGHMPFVVNPDCGRTPDPVLFGILLEGFGLLAVAVVAGRVVSWARRHWPGISTAKLIGLLALGALAIEIAIEFPIVAAGGWTYIGGPSIPLGHAFRYAPLEFIGGTGTFLLAAVRVFKDDQGRTFVERKVDGLRPRWRKPVTFLALYAVFQLIGDGVGNIIILTGPYAPPPPKMPAYVVNDVCDAPGIHGTRYGPCPGSTGYRMPGRQTDLPTPTVRAESPAG